MKQFLLICFLVSGSLLHAEKEKPLVLATVNIIGDMATILAGEHLDVRNIVPLGGDPHTYEPVPQDAILVESANLILKNGLTLEGWISELIDNSGTKAKSYIMSEGVPIIKSASYANSPDPHAWMVATNGIVYAQNIVRAFKELDPEHAADYDKNLAAYTQELNDLHNFMLAEFKKIPAESRILITSHDAFQYFGKAYGLRLESMIGTSTDDDIQTSDIIRLEKVIKESNVPALFAESTINPKTLKQLAKDNKVNMGGELYADSLGDEESGANTYVNMLRHNTNTIVNGLTGKGNPIVEEKESPKSRWIMYAIIAVLFVGGFGFIAKKMN